MTAGVLAAGAVGCAGSSATTRPSSVYDRQEQALRDPFSYTPDLHKADRTVSGNGEFDSQGIGRDVDDVVNP